MSPPRLISRAAVLGAVCALGVVGAGAAPTASSAAAATATAPAIAVAGDAPVAPTSTTQSFLGIAAELNTIPTLAGPATDPDTPFVALLKHLSPGAPLSLRLGGNSTDDSWWPTPVITRPHYLYALTPQWAARVRALLGAVDARAILGVNLESDSAPLAAAEVADDERYIGPSLIQDFELGNEPEFFPVAVPKTIPPGRARNLYRYTHYGRQFTAIASALGDVPLAGPSSGSPHWLPRLGTVLDDMPSRLKLVTVHAYPLKDCSRLTHLSVSAFFTPASIQGLAASVHVAVKAAAAHGKPLRVDEINGVSCGGEAGLSNSFGEALWALNVLPALWQAGVQGVNFQTIDGGAHFHDLNQMFTATHPAPGWRVAVEPVYYGLRAFAEVAPAGSHLLRISDPRLFGVYEYAVRTPGGSERVVLTNVGSAARTIEISAAGTHGTGSVSLLTAGSLGATGGVTLAGQSLSPRTGQLTGRPQVTRLGRDRRGSYPVRVPAHSAAVLTLARN